jgi:hypothetical protein
MEAAVANPPEPPTHALRFGEDFEGESPTIVTYDIFGFQSYYYEQAQGKYIADDEDFLWHIKLSDCTNIDEFNNIALPGRCGVQHYLEAGLDNLGYIATVAAHPELAEYADNPGLLALLIAHLAKAKPLLARSPNRRDLVAALSGSDRICNFHISWLKKVRPGEEHPAAVAARLEASILRVPACNLARSDSSYAARRYKLFAHQRQWTARGLDLARALLQREDIAIDDISYLMHSFNGAKPSVINQVRAALMEFGDNEYYLSRLARLRARQLARHDQLLTLRFAKNFRRGLSQPGSERNSMDLCALFLSDEDIPLPRLKSNPHVMALDTLDKLRSHARKAENCVWSPHIISRILLRQIDLYAVKGENHYTISLDRRTFEIAMIEPFKGMKIKPGDLGLIAQWFEEATELPR